MTRILGESDQKRSRTYRWLFYFLALFMTGASAMAQPKAPADDENPFPNRPKAPPLSGGLGWLNSAGPIDLSKLKGKVVLLDFWTYCCINCIHILPDLAKLEAEFPNELVVIGVHSAKFEGEKDTDNIREAAMRYEIKHPIVNDGDMMIWRRYDVNSWPTQVLIDPEGNYLGQVSGEGNYEPIREVIRRVIAYHGKRGTLDKTPLHFQLESYGRAETPLYYPGKIAVDAAANRLVIADSGHHRVVVTDLAGKVIHVIGTGEVGLADGKFDEAKFNEPQGIAIRGDILFVADRRNHVLREIDLKEGTVKTIAGTGVQGHERNRSGPAREIPLASPWDVLLAGDDLYIAMAGTHQLWKLNLPSGKIEPFAGSGAENIYDAPLEEAALAQPSGLASDGKFLYFADSETSSIRRVNFEEGTVETIVGKGLFEFGDKDGEGDKVRLQHALAVVIDKEGQLYVADTYNNKIKTLNPTTKASATFLGDGKGELSDDPARFDEPAGLALAGDSLYVADTNNHAVRVVDLPTKTVKTLEIVGLTPPKVEKGTEELPNSSVKKVDPVILKDPKSLAIRARVPVAENEKLNDKAPMRIRVRFGSEGQEKKVLQEGPVTPVSPDAAATLENVDLSKGGTLEVAVTYFPCETGSEGVCRIKTQTWEIPISIGAGGTADLNLEP